MDFFYLLLNSGFEYNLFVTGVKDDLSCTFTYLFFITYIPQQLCWFETFQNLATLFMIS